MTVYYTKFTPRPDDPNKASLDELIRLRREWLKSAHALGIIQIMNYCVIHRGDDFHEDMPFPWNQGGDTFLRFTLGNLEIVYMATFEKADPRTGEPIPRAILTARIGTSFPVWDGLVCHWQMGIRPDDQSQDSIFVPGRWVDNIAGYYNVLIEEVEKENAIDDETKKAVLVERLMLDERLK